MYLVGNKLTNYFGSTYGYYQMWGLVLKSFKPKDSIRLDWGFIDNMSNEIGYSHEEENGSYFIFLTSDQAYLEKAPPTLPSLCQN